MKVLTTLLIVGVVMASFVYGMLSGIYKSFPYYLVYPIKQKIDLAIAKATRPSIELSQDLVVELIGEAVASSTIWKKLELPARQILNNESELNAFTLNWARIDSDEIGKIASAKFEKGAVEFINQNDKKLLETLGLSSETLLNDGIKAVFEISNEQYVYVSFADEECAAARIVNITSGKIVLELPCLPEAPKQRPDEPRTPDFNAAGGGFLYLNENTILLSTGTPTNSTALIQALAQDDSSPWGKILKITFGAENVDVSVYAKGLRNPQGITEIDGVIYAVEHGPMGGDEINVILEGKNYGWPDQSLGTNYNYSPINKDYGDANGVEIPLLAFVPSIATSYVGRCPDIYAEYYLPNKCLSISTLRDESLYFVVFERANHVLFTERLNLDSRIRKYEIVGNKLTAITDFEGVIVGEFSLSE